jgi:molybdate transport system substrate-binding protein
MNKAQAFFWLLAITPLLQSGRLPSGWQGASGPIQHQKVLIAAAADLRYAMDTLVAVYRQAHPGSDIQVVYGSSGNFYEQIRNGAPFDLFFSADRNYPDQLQTQGKVIGTVTDYGIGRLVLWSLRLDPAAQGIHTLEAPAISKIAIANPDHAPYGKRAVESLRYYGIYDKISPKLVIGENISQAAQFAMSGSADAGIIALALALSPPMRQTGGKYWLIPDASHGRLEQGYALLPHATGNNDALDFQAFIRSAAARSILNRFGFGNP